MFSVMPYLPGLMLLNRPLRLRLSAAPPGALGWTPPQQVKRPLVVPLSPDQLRAHRGQHAGGVWAGDNFCQVNDADAVLPLEPLGTIRIVPLTLPLFPAPVRAALGFVGLISTRHGKKRTPEPAGQKTH